MNNANALFNNHAPFNSSNLPFDQSSNSTLLDDLPQFPAPQQQQQPRSGEGNSRNPTPTFHPTYQVNPSVPAKRAHPGEEAVTASPRSASANPNSSRSQTPQQGLFPSAIAGQQKHGGQQFQPHTPYQHLQTPASNNASPSPTIQNQQYRPAVSQPSRMQNHSPQNAPANNATFSHQQQIQNNMSRMSTLQSGSNQQFMQNFNPNAIGGSGMMPNNMPAQISGSNPPAQGNAAQIQEAQRRYQMQLQQNLHGQNTAHGSFSRPASTMNDQNASGWQTPRQNGSGASQGTLAGRPMQQQIPSTQPQSQQVDNARLYHTFQTGLNKFLSENGLALDPDPRIAGMKINWYKLFLIVAKFLPMNAPPSQRGTWEMVAKYMGFDVNQHPTAPQEVKTLFENNLMSFYMNYQNNVKHKRELTGRTAGQIHESPSAASQPPTKPLQHQPFAQPDFAQQNRLSGSVDFSPSSLEQNTTPHVDANGFATVHQQGGNPQPSVSNPQNLLGHLKNTASQISQNDANHVNQAMSQTPPRPVSQQSETKAWQSLTTAKDTTGTAIESPSATEYVPSSKPLKDTYGGYRLDASVEHGLQHATRNVTNLQLAVATQDLRVVDILSVTKMLQSGFIHEVSAALDQLTMLVSREEHSQAPHQRLDVALCEELLDALVDCAEAQIYQLDEAAAILSEKLTFRSFENLSKMARIEDSTIKARHCACDEDSRLDHSAERVLAISAIIRNISSNHLDIEGRRVPCANPMVVSFFCTTLRLIGTRDMLLRTARNTLDFMKDVVVYLSNTAQGIGLTSEDEAQTITAFLAAFSPLQPLETDLTLPLRFVPYHPAKHQYLPSAVDALAKLLARDQPEQPNRAYMKAVFLSDTTPRPCDLMTRIFALAIAPLPDSSRFPAEALAVLPAGSKPLVKRDSSILILTDRRKAFISQGMLAADILASLVSSSESGPARLWLESEDGWAPNLLRLALRLVDEQVAFFQIRDATEETAHDQGHRDFGMIILQSLSMLQRLVEKLEASGNAARLDTKGWPPLDDMMAELQGNNRIHPRVLKQISSLSRLLS